MKIDEEKELCDLSDHNLIEVKIKVTSVKRVIQRRKINPILLEEEKIH